MTLPSIAVCIPAYGRPEEFATLLSSIELQTQHPNEVLICEDGSLQRGELAQIFKDFFLRMHGKNCTLRFVENPVNLGYDGNLRTLIHQANSDYVFFIGNDDYILPEGIVRAREFLSKHTVLAASRSFLRFDQDPLNPIGVSRVYDSDQILNRSNTDAGRMIRIGGFFGGLLFKRDWAQSLSTERYDGTLYYQIYLLLNAYASGDVGYIGQPTVAARADNAPLFGSASSEKGIFTPGRYTVAARAKMWESILKITQDTEQEKSMPMLAAVRHELSGRMSFHLFEMFAGRPKTELNGLKYELVRLGLFNHWMPKVAYWMNRFLGQYASLVYRAARKALQR